MLAYREKAGLGPVPVKEVKAVEAKDDGQAAKLAEMKQQIDQINTLSSK